MEFKSIKAVVTDNYELYENRIAKSKTVKTRASQNVIMLSWVTTLLTLMSQQFPESNNF